MILVAKQLTCSFQEGCNIYTYTIRNQSNVALRGMRIGVYVTHECHLLISAGDIRPAMCSRGHGDIPSSAITVHNFPTKPTHSSVLSPMSGPKTHKIIRMIAMLLLIMMTMMMTMTIMVVVLMVVVIILSLSLPIFLVDN